MCPHTPFCMRALRRYIYIHNTTLHHAMQTTALMGPSGSGKTTLLDVLAGRKTVGALSGDVRFGGAIPSKAFLSRHTVCATAKVFCGLILNTFHPAQ